MNSDEIYKNIIGPSVQRANDEMPSFNLPDMDVTTPLYGVKGAILDSLNLVSFVFIIEEEFQRVTGKVLKITTQDVLNSEAPPFANLTALCQFLKVKLESAR
jgi:acyl carrier protein